MYLMMFFAVLAAGDSLESMMREQLLTNVIAFVVSQPILGLLWWGAFAKANQPPWAGFVPVYREMIMCEMTDKPAWWAIFSIVCPCVWLIMYIMIMIEMANRFGQGGGFAVGLILLGIIFIPIMGYGNARYRGGKRGRGQRRRDDDDDRPRRGGRDDDDDDDDDRPRRKPRARDDDDDDDEDDRRVRRRPRDDD